LISNVTKVYPRELKDVCGIGRGLSKKLHYLGVHHPIEINLLDDKTLHDTFGPHWAVELKKIARGEETHLFTHEKEVTYQQSVGRTITGWKLCDDEEQIQRVLLNLLEEATHKLRAMDLVGRKVGISLWGHDRHWGEYRTLQYWVRHTDEIWKLLYDGMYKKWRRDFPVIKFGVWIGE
jgi:nucleotidyltransferase/DNA polymerase involved in DNA repair